MGAGFIVDRLALIVVMAIVMAVFSVLAHRANVARNKRNLPDEAQKARVLAEIREWKALGYDYRKRVGLLRRQG